MLGKLVTIQFNSIEIRRINRLNSQKNRRHIIIQTAKPNKYSPFWRFKQINRKEVCDFEFGFGFVLTAFCLSTQISRWLFPFICLPFHIECTLSSLHIYFLKEKKKKFELWFLLRSHSTAAVAATTCLCYGAVKWYGKSTRIRGQSSSNVQFFGIYLNISRKWVKRNEGK